MSSLALQCRSSKCLVLIPHRYLRNLSPLVSGVICIVVAIFYLVGWEMGAVEAVSLSILVGSSVDYCVHVVEGYLLAGDNPPPSAMQVSVKYTGKSFH